MYCFWRDPKEYDLNAEDTYEAGENDSKSYWFELPEGLTPSRDTHLTGLAADSALDVSESGIDHH
jgi:hypothetical protein